MADYRSTLTGTQMDQALLDMAEHNSEAYAVGERNGIAVASDDVTYHNNARYYAQIASSQIVGDASSAVRWDTDQSEALTDAQKAQARENINAASDSDVVKITSQTLTTAQQEQARVNIMAGGSNRNLLDNPFFQVNQRGWTSGTANAAFTVDRWKMASAYGTKQVTVNADGTITIDGLFFQKIEPYFIAGQVVTISYMTADGNVVSKTGTIGTTEGYAVGNAAFGLYYRPSTGVCDFQIQADNLTLRACKVEFGSVSTLANDVPPNYAEELAKCQRYFVRLGGLYANVGFGAAMSTTIGYILIPTPVPMRNASNTVTVSYSEMYLFANSGYAHTISSITVQNGGYSFNAAGVTVSVNSSGLVAGEPLLLQPRASGGYLDLSADL